MGVAEATVDDQHALWTTSLFTTEQSAVGYHGGRCRRDETEYSTLTELEGLTSTAMIRRELILFEDELVVDFLKIG